MPTAVWIHVFSSENSAGAKFAELGNRRAPPHWRGLSPPPCQHSVPAQRILFLRVLAIEMNQLSRAILRAVIFDQRFNFGSGLGLSAINGSGEPRLASLARHDDMRRLDCDWKLAECRLRVLLGRGDVVANAGTSARFVGSCLRAGAEYGLRQVFCQLDQLCRRQSAC